MSNRYLKNPSIVNKCSESESDENYWLKQFEKNLEKQAVQSRKVDDSLFNQINNIMGTKSKHKSVSAAVEDMMQRSGLTGYLENVKTSQEETRQTKKAHDHEHKHEYGENYPKIFIKVPSIAGTIKNYIRDTRGNLPILAIIEKAKSIHHKDISDSNDWDDKNLAAFISQENTKEKANNPSNSDANYSQLGIQDRNLDIDNNDAFKGLMPSPVK